MLLAYLLVLWEFLHGGCILLHARSRFGGVGGPSLKGPEGELQWLDTKSRRFEERSVHYIGELRDRGESVVELGAVTAVGASER